MAFNLKKVLKALLFSSNQPLSIKDIQAAFTRFHEQATLPLADWADEPNPVAADAVAAVAGQADAASPVAAPAEEPPEVIAETVATPIEQEVTGVEDMLYMSSQCTVDGQMELTVTFTLDF